MDVLAQLLTGARARGGDFNQMLLDPPWSLRIADGAALALVTMLRGTAWVVTGDGPPARVGPGDVAVVCGTAPYTGADDPATPPQLLIHSGGRCEPLDPVAATAGADQGVRTHGSRPDAADLVVSGCYQLSADVGRQLLLALPRVLVVDADQVPTALVELVRSEISRDEPGQQVVLDRWLDLALIATLRAWFARPESHPPGWYQAQSDPVVGPALRLLHAGPAEPWTVAELARRVGMSRAGLARRFTTLVGEPPMAYLARWRIALAADRLSTSTDTVESVARAVGYANAFALSVAFKRLRGVSPGAHRHAVGETSAASESMAQA
jgi:AraC-like DNA-binding protein